MYGIMERTPGAPSITAWVKQDGAILLYKKKEEAQNKANEWNKNDSDRYFVKGWI